MKAIVDSKQMKEIDRRTINEYGVDSLLLMERAALFACRVIFEDLRPGESVLVLAGSGNNGGDGIAVARLLFAEGVNAAILYAGNPDHATAENYKQLEMAKAYGVPVLEDATSMSGYDVIVDAMLGVGSFGAPREEMAALISAANLLPARRIAIDIPTGVSADTGAVETVAFAADVTVTFGYEKVGHHIYPGRSYCGRVVRDRLGFPERLLPEKDKLLFVMEKGDISRLLPARSPMGNKGTFGKVLVVAGSKGMAGAAYLAAAAAFAAGCGMVRIISAEDNRTILQQLIPDAMFAAYDSEYESVLEQGMDWADAVLVGPGLSTGNMAGRIFAYIMTHCEKPLVVDADGLNLFALSELDRASGDVVFTPHIGEMARLTGSSPSAVAAGRFSAAKDYAGEYGVTMVLKDASTVIYDKKGQGYINTSGNSGMAVAGSGDVLSGVIASLMAQGCPGNVAAPLGAYIHGLAGDEAAGHVSEKGMRSVHLLNGLDSVWQEIYG